MPPFLQLLGTTHEGTLSLHLVPFHPVEQLQKLAAVHTPLTHEGSHTGVQVNGLLDDQTPFSSQL